MAWGLPGHTSTESQPTEQLTGTESEMKEANTGVLKVDANIYSLGEK